MSNAKHKLAASQAHANLLYTWRTLGYARSGIVGKKRIEEVIDVGRMTELQDEIMNMMLALDKYIHSK